MLADPKSSPNTGLVRVDANDFRRVGGFLLPRTASAAHMPRMSDLALFTPPDPMNTIRAFLAVACLSVLVSGCNVTRYASPTGEKFSRWAIGARTSVSSLRVETGTNGLRQLDLKGYQNDTAATAAAVTESAVRAAVQSVNPVK